MEPLHLLVVDDEMGMRKSIRKALQNYELRLPEIDETIRFDVDTAGTGEEALQKISTRKPDILLLDYKLPGMSGLDVLEKVISGGSEMAVVMITAYASLETAVTAVRQGAFDFLAKPFNPGELKSAIKKAAQHLILARHVKKLAEERRQVRFQFISVLGHELKSPINAVEGYLHLMKGKTLGENLEDYTEILDRCLIRTQGMMKMILDLLDLTRIESGQKVRELDEHDIRPILQTALETAMPAAGKKGIDIDIKGTFPVSLICDPGELEIIFNNLLSNAVKYNRPNGRVTVSVRKKDGIVSIAVQDTGIGMTGEEISRLFREFGRIKNNKTRHITGSGLGLAIVKKICRLYDGSVQAESIPDGGTTFTIRLKDGHTK